MIRVTVDLCPGGDEQRALRIGWMKVWREHLEAKPTSRYTFRYSTKGSTSMGEGVEHRRIDDVFVLLRAVLNHSEPTPGYCHTCHRMNDEQPA